MKTALEYCEDVSAALKEVSGQSYAEWFCDFRMEFQREYLKGVVCSTMLGADFFEFTARAIRGLENERLNGKEFSSGYNADYRKWIAEEKRNYTFITE